jgi:hypothetical protein
MAQKIEIVRGTTNTFNIAVRDADGREYALADGEKIVFGIKRNLDDPEAIVVKTATAGTDGVYAVTIVPSDTADLDPGRYHYDVGLQSGENYFNVIEHNPFIIQANVTRRGDGA